MNDVKRHAGVPASALIPSRRAVLLGTLASMAPLTPARFAVAAERTPVPGASDLLPSFRIHANKALAAGTPITLGQAFAKGAVSKGGLNQLIVSTRAGQTAQVQVDQANAWPDGSLRFAALSFLTPVALSAGQVIGFQVASGSGTLSGPAPTAAQLASATDFAVKVRGRDFGRDTFTVSANDVLGTMTPWNARTGWGRDPLGGWEIVRSGPLCTEWRIWRFLKRDGDGASHRWVKAVLYVRAWSDGRGGILGCHVLPGLQQSNCYGPQPRGTVGSPALTAYAGIVELVDGARRITAYGGPHDPNGAQSVSTYPMRGWWGALGDGSVPWAGSNPAASYMVAHDAAYLTRRTRLLPPYKLDLDVPRYPGRDKYQVNVSMLGPDINATGDANDDERIGYIHYTGLCLLLNPLDREREIRELAFGWSWADWPIWQTDERTGQPVNTTGAQVGPLPANPDYAAKWGAHLGNPGWIGEGDNIPSRKHFDYGFIGDASHLPSLWIVPLLRTGHAAFQEMAVASACALPAAIDSGGRNITYKGKTYDNVFSFFWSNYNNARSVGWSARIWGCADRMVPDAHPMRDYIRRVMDANAAFAAIGPLNPEPDFDRLGMIYTNHENAGDPNSGTEGSHLFMNGIVTLGLAMEAWVGDRSGWQALLDKMQPASIGIYDNDLGEFGWISNLYSMSGWDARYAVYPNISAQVRDNAARQLKARAPFPATGINSADLGPPGRASLPFAATVARAGIAMQAWLDRPTSGAVKVVRQLDKRLGTDTPGGLLRFAGSDGAYPTWAIAAPEPGPRHQATAETGRATAAIR